MIHPGTRALWASFDPPRAVQPSRSFKWFELHRTSVWPPAFGTRETLLAGNSICRDERIRWISAGYFLSHEIRSTVARPLGLERFPSPRARPMTYALRFASVATGFARVDGAGGGSPTLTGLRPHDFESCASGGSATPALSMLNYRYVPKGTQMTRADYSYREVALCPYLRLDPGSRAQNGVVVPESRNLTEDRVT